MNAKPTYCQNCNEPVQGRIDKKFCSSYCKSNFHYLLNKQKQDSTFKIVDKQLKVNRRILKNFNKAGKATVRAELLLKQGFNPSYFTHYWKNKKNDVYLFCYEFGFLKRIENNKIKFILVTWQDYMKPG